MSDLLNFLGIGKLLIYLIQKSPIQRLVPEGLLRELIQCDFCLGFWVYLFLGVILDQDLDKKFRKRNNLVSKIITASFSTFIVHLISIGWREKFETVIIE